MPHEPLHFEAEHDHGYDQQDQQRNHHVRADDDGSALHALIVQECANVVVEPGLALVGRDLGTHTLVKMSHFSFIIIADLKCAQTDFFNR